MSSSHRIEALLQAVRNLSYDQALALEKVSYTNHSMEFYAVNNRLSYIAYWFDYLQDWEPQFSEAIDSVLERKQVGLDDEPYNSASHEIRLAYQALIYEQYLKPEEFTLATESILSILE